MKNIIRIALLSFVLLLSMTQSTFASEGGDNSYNESRSVIEDMSQEADANTSTVVEDTSLSSRTTSTGTKEKIVNSSTSTNFWVTIFTDSKLRLQFLILSLLALLITILVVYFWNKRRLQRDEEQTIG